jgi:hypothetical protein
MDFSNNVDLNIAAEMDEIANASESRLLNSISKFRAKTNLTNAQRKKVVYLPVPPRSLKKEEKDANASMATKYNRAKRQGSCKSKSKSKSKSNANK